jgi:hypothetical protein
MYALSAEENKNEMVDWGYSKKELGEIWTFSWYRESPDSTQRVGAAERGKRVTGT